MNILVCIKQVPGSNNVQIDPIKGTLIRTKDNNKINPYDLFAIESALRLKELYGGRVTSLTMGPPQSKIVVEESIAMGCDNGIVLSDRAFAGSDVLSTSYALSQAIKKFNNFDLIICGKQTTDGDTAQVGVELAEFLNIPNLSNVVSITKINEKYLSVNTNQEKLFVRQTIQLPCLLNIDNGINTPRLPSYKRMNQNMDIIFFTLDDLEDKKIENYGLDGSATQVEKIFPPDKVNDRFIYEDNPELLSFKIYDLFLEKKYLL